MISVLNYIIDEILSFRERGTPLHRRELLPVKLALFIASIVVPFTTKLEIAVSFVVGLWSAVLLLGLRRTALYIVASTTLLYITISLTALALHGDVERIIRSLMVATATLSTGLLIFATVQPSHLRRFQTLYLLLITLNNVLRELRDVQIVLRSRGETGFRYYLRIFTISIEVALTRIDVLIDSLKARGIEVTQ